MTPAKRLLLACAVGGAVVLPACGSSSPTTPTTTSPTDTFSGSLTPLSTASRAFTAATAGTATVTLTTLNPGDAVVGLGIGIPKSANTGCLLSMSMTTAAGSSPQLTKQVDAGTFCVEIYDAGNVTGTTTFTVQIAHP